MQLRPASSEPSPNKSAVTELRGIPGGYDLDRWPISVPIHADETLASWAARVAHRYGLSPAALFRQLHLQLGYYRLNIVERTLAEPQTEVSLRTNFDDLAREAHWQRSQETIRRIFDGHLSAPDPPALKGSRFCPECLQSTPYWRSSWRDPLTVACPDHGLLLAEMCPSCGQEPFASSAWAMNERSVTECPEDAPDQERQPRTRRRKCGADLRSTPSQPADAATLSAAALISEAQSNPQGKTTAAGLPASYREAAEALNTVVCMLTSEHSQRPSRDNIRTAIYIAHRMLEQPTLAEAAAFSQKHEVLGDALQRITWIAPLVNGQVLPSAHPILQAIYLESIRDQLPLTLQLTYRLESAWPRPPQGVELPQPTGPRHYPRWNTQAVPFHIVPQLWWVPLDEAEDIVGSESDLFSISLGVCNAGRSMTLASMSEALGSTKAYARRVTSTWKRLAESMGWRALQKQFNEAADALHDHPPPIDYQRRRQTLPSPQAVKKLLEEHGTEVRLADEELLWVWSVATQSSPNLIPTEHRNELAVRTSPRAPSVSLNRIVTQALEACFDEPLTWAPP